MRLGAELSGAILSGNQNILQTVSMHRFYNTKQIIKKYKFCCKLHFSSFIFIYIQNRNQGYWLLQNLGSPLSQFSTPRPPFIKNIPLFKKIICSNQSCDFELRSRCPLSVVAGGGVLMPTAFAHILLYQLKKNLKSGILLMKGGGAGDRKLTKGGT